MKDHTRTERVIRNVYEDVPPSMRIVSEEKSIQCGFEGCSFSAEMAVYGVPLCLEHYRLVQFLDKLEKIKFEKECWVKDP